MAAQPKKKTSKVRSKTRRAHRHDAITNEHMWQGGMLAKKERQELYAQRRRKKGLATSTPDKTTKTKSETPESKPAKATKKPSAKKDSK